MDFEFKRVGVSNTGCATGSDSQLESCLSSVSFDVKQFVRDVSVKYDSAREWSKHKKKVQNLADRTAQQLKQNVFKNYVLFIDSSKEISALEAEMYQLSHYLHEQNVLTQSLQSLSLSIIENKPSMQEMERAEKQEQQHSISFLLEAVEGGSIVTEVPDRYLIHSSHLYELDRESYRELGEVRAFLLNDSLMTASSVPERQGPVRYTFQALYELDNMAIMNVKDTDTLKFAFKILMFPDSHLFQAESDEDKQQWITMLERTKRKHKEEVDAAKKEAIQRLRSKTVGVSFLGVHGKTLNKGAVSVSTGKKEEMLMEDWIKEVPETLDVYIEQREFDRAVDLTLSTKSFLKGFSDSHATRDIRARLNHRINRLSEVLMKELEASPSGSLRGGPRAARRAVGLLLKLGRSAKACSLFLENYRQVIQHDLSDVKMEDSMNLFATNFASTFFTGLRNAATEFERAFDKNYGSYSSFIVWCNNLLKIFAEKSSKVIFSPSSKGSIEGSPLSIITDCILSIMKECDALNDLGLDLSFALWYLYHPHLAQALHGGKKHIMDVCATSGTVETWAPLDLSKKQPKLTAIILQMQSLGMKEFGNLVHDSIVDLSSTTVNFCMMTIDFMNNVFRIYTPQLLEDFIACFCDIFRNMVVLYNDALGRDENISMTDCIIGDAQFVIQTLLPTFIDKMNLETGVDIPDLVELHGVLQEMFEKQSCSVPLAAIITKPAMQYEDGEEGESVDGEEEEASGDREDGKSRNREEEENDDREEGENGDSEKEESGVREEVEKGDKEEGENGTEEKEYGNMDSDGEDDVI